MNTILLAHILSCWIMTGVIWMVQLLVYPFFRWVGQKEFSSLHQFHMSRISWIVVPIMTLELLTAIWLYIENREQLFFWNLASVVSLWVLTALVNVPTHNNLKFESEASKINLVIRNWPRTLIWSGRSLFLFAALSTSSMGLQL